MGKDVYDLIEAIERTLDVQAALIEGICDRLKAMEECVRMTGMQPFLFPKIVQYRQSDGAPTPSAPDH